MTGPIVEDQRTRVIKLVANALPSLPIYCPDPNCVDPDCEADKGGKPDLSTATLIYNALRDAGMLDIYASGYNPMLAALDRCLHGRHAKDHCADCGGKWSRGNTFLTPGQRIGTNLYGHPIVVPEEQGHRSNPDRWVVGQDGGRFL